MRRFLTLTMICTAASLSLWSGGVRAQAAHCTPGSVAIPSGVEAGRSVGRPVCPAVRPETRARDDAQRRHHQAEVLDRERALRRAQTGGNQNDILKARQELQRANSTLDRSRMNPP